MFGLNCLCFGQWTNLFYYYYFLNEKVDNSYNDGGKSCKSL